MDEWMSPNKDKFAKPVVAVILAGGLARRMNGEVKPLKTLAGKPILLHIIGRITAQVDQVILNVNQHTDLFLPYRLPIVADSVKGFVGPLGGILAGMDWIAENMLECEHMISLPGDGPFIPSDLVSRLMRPVNEGQAQLTAAVANGRRQPVVGAWDISLRAALRQALVEEKIYKVDAWTAGYEIKHVDFTQDHYDPFFNTNKVEDLKQAEEIFRTCFT